MSSVSVIYLERFGNDPVLVDGFIKSIEKHPAGADFEYIHIRKGFPDKADKSEGFPKNYKIYHVEDVGYALSSLVDILEQLTCEKFIFFTSYSKILADNWLSYYLNAFSNVDNCGVVGATGSYEGRRCLRTNAFMMDRVLFLELAEKKFKDRTDECNFEAGENNLTDKINKVGLVAVVIDRDGKYWFMDEWKQSKTFRWGNQVGLLVSDNRTDHYSNENEQNKQYLRELTWGSAS